MSYSRLALLNSSILTEFGTYHYEPISRAKAKQLLHKCNTGRCAIESLIGHQPTAELLSEILDFPVSVSRSEFHQAVGDAALVFRLKRRLREFKSASKEEIRSIGYEFGLLTRLS
jgi:Domain of unknown function (DUF1874)